jgi:hypothetical protein
MGAKMTNGILFYGIVNEHLKFLFEKLIYFINI